jgi:hypothetical protein
MKINIAALLPSYLSSVYAKVRGLACLISLQIGTLFGQA